MIKWLIIITLVFFGLSFFILLGSCMKDVNEEVKYYEDNINVELETQKPTIANEAQELAENSRDIEDFLNKLEANKIYPSADTMNRDNLCIYFKYTFKDDSKLKIDTKRSSRIIIDVEVVE